MNEDDLFFNTIEFSELRKKYEVLEVNFHKSEIENTKKNKEIQRLQDELQKYRKVTNDASTDYPWPEEFCERWKKLFESTIMDSFDNIFYKSILLVRVINITVKIVYDIAKEKINEKIIEILNCFGVENKSENYLKNFFKKFQTCIFQDFFRSIIKFDDILEKKILLNIRLEIGTQKGNLFSELEIEEINKDLDSKQIIFFLQELFYLSLYMHFHDPLLSIKTSTELSYSYFSKKDFISLDGFGNENSVCLLILSPPVLKLNTYFKQLVPIVFICENPTEEMIKQCELKKYYQLRKLQSKSFNAMDTPLVFNLHNQINCEEKNTINSEKKDNEKEFNENQLKNINNNNNGIYVISNMTSLTTGATFPSNRNNNSLFNNNDKINNINNINNNNNNNNMNNNIKNKNIKEKNENTKKKKEYTRSKSSIKPLQEKRSSYNINNNSKNNINNNVNNYINSNLNNNSVINNDNNNTNMNFIINQEQLFKNKQKKQINSNTANESTISQNNNSNYKNNEKLIFNVINNNQTQNNNIKKEKSFTISAEEINQEEPSPSNVLRLKREIELNNIKSKLSIEKVDNKSRNNSTFEFEANNNTNKVKDENFENFPIKLVTEIHNGYSPKNNQNFLKTPIQKKRTNSIGSQSEKSAITGDYNSKIIDRSSIVSDNQRQIKTTIRKVNNMGNSYLRKTISTVEQNNNINEQNNNNQNISHVKNNINNNNNNNSNNINYSNKKNDKVALYNMDISGNNNYESASYRSSSHNLIRNNSQSNDNRLHNISTNSICSNHGNSKELKSTYPISSNNFIMNNINKQSNINNKIEYFPNKNNINKESLANIVFNSRKGFDYSNNQPIKTDYDNYIANNTLEWHGPKNEESSTLNSNRVGNNSNTKNSYFSTNDIKAMKIFNKNELQKKGSKTLIGKKTDNPNIENQHFQNPRIKSPSMKNTLNYKNNNNFGYNTKSPKMIINPNNNSVYNNGNNIYPKDKKFHSTNQFNKYKKK